MTLLEQITEDLHSLTDDQVQRSVAHLPPPKATEPILGLLANYHTKTLWALAFEYDRRARKMIYDAMYETPEEDARVLALNEGRRLDGLADVIRALAWVGIRHELPAGWDDASGTCSLGVRANFVIVSVAKNAPSKAALLGAIKLPAAIGQMLAQIGKAGGIEIDLSSPPEEDDDAPILPPRHRRTPRKPS